MTQSITISKLDAARRQLETAIRLYFMNGDPVSIHTLVAAAHEILRDLTHHRGASKMLMKDSLLDILKPEGKKIWQQTINKAENFFKHADRDHGSTLDFSSGISEYFLIDAVSQYFTLTGEDLPLFAIYRLWFMANHLNELDLEDRMKRTVAQQALECIPMGKAMFFQKMLPVAMSASLGQQNI